MMLPPRIKSGILCRGASRVMVLPVGDVVMVEAAGLGAG